MRKPPSLAIALLLLATACRDPFGLGTTVKLPIAELTVPATVSPQGPLNFSVSVVTGGCREFDRITTRRAASVLIVEAWGTDSSGGARACTDDIRYEPHTSSANGPFTDPLVVGAIEPDGTSITKSVKVE
jgi:hypothetical protein